MRISWISTQDRQGFPTLSDSTSLGMYMTTTTILQVIKVTICLIKSPVPVKLWAPCIVRTVMIYLAKKSFRLTKTPTTPIRYLILRRVSHPDTVSLCLPGWIKLKKKGVYTLSRLDCHNKPVTSIKTHGANTPANLEHSSKSLPDVFRDDKVLTMMESSAEVPCETCFRPLWRVTVPRLFYYRTMS